MKIDPIIGVADVQKSAKWYQTVFGWKSSHGGDEFEILLDAKGEVMLCLHKWGTHDHPTMVKPSAKVGNGLILYYRTKDMPKILQNLNAMDYKLESDLQLNPNSRKQEFSFRDLDGHYFTISEYHTFTG